MVILYWEGYRHYKLNKKALENASKTLMVELVGTRSFATCSEISGLQASSYLKSLLQIATGNFHPLGAVPHQFIQKKPNPERVRHFLVEQIQNNWHQIYQELGGGGSYYLLSGIVARLILCPKPCFKD